MGRKLRIITPNAGQVSTHNITKIVEAVKKMAKGEKIIFVGKSKEKKLCSKRIRKNQFIGITEISHGCDGRCSYCCVRLAKGKLHCYPPKDILKDAGNAIKDGCREIWLTSQDNAAYNHNGKGLPWLIDKICRLDYDFKIRIGMMDPNNVIKIMDDLIEVYKNDKVYKFLHLPVQSGSDKILKKMRRKYRVSDFLEIVSEFRKSIPPITLSTDIIVGLPGESKEDFSKTVKLIEKIQPDIVNVSKFSPRPGTEATEMPQLDKKIIKLRSAEISKFVRDIALERNKRWVGWKGEILVTENGTKKNQYAGRNFAYRPVLVESEKELMGKKVNVMIKKAEVTHLVGNFYLGIPLTT
jgi:MiaB-like tRNA modifying enzyme